MMATFPTFSLAEGKPDVGLKQSGEGASPENNFLSILAGLGAPGEETGAEAEGPNPTIASAFALPIAMPKAALSAGDEAEGDALSKDQPDETSSGEADSFSDQPWAALLGMPSLLPSDGTTAPHGDRAGATSSAPAGTRAMLLTTTSVPAGDPLAEGKGALSPFTEGTAKPANLEPIQASMKDATAALPAGLAKAALNAGPGGADTVHDAGEAPAVGAPKLDGVLLDTARVLADMAPAFASTTTRPADQVASTASPLAPAADIGGQLIEHHLDLAHEGRWLDQLAKDIARAGSADGQLRFRLDPENLGRLNVELRNGDTGTAIRLVADTEAARALLADAQPRLIAEARAQGVRIAETHVDLGSGGFGQGHSMADQQREHRGMEGEAYLTTFKPKQADETVAPSATRHAAERYA